MIVIKAEPILKKRLNVKSVMNRYGDLAIKQMSLTTQTWQNTDPTFSKLMEGERITIAPEDDEDGKIWGYLNNGTDVRHAVMTPGFQAKTKPGFLPSGQGSGGVGFVSKDIVLPGIEARGWTDLIKDDLGPKYEADIERMLSKSIL